MLSTSDQRKLMRMSDFEKGWGKAHKRADAEKFQRVRPTIPACWAASRNQARPRTLPARRAPQCCA